MIQHRMFVIYSSFINNSMQIKQQRIVDKLSYNVFLIIIICIRNKNIRNKFENIIDRKIP